MTPSEHLLTTACKAPDSLVLIADPYLIQGLKSIAHPLNSGGEAGTSGITFIFTLSRAQTFLDPHHLLLSERCPLLSFFCLKREPLSATQRILSLLSHGLQLHYKHFAHLRLEPVDENSFLMFSVVCKNCAIIQLKAVSTKGKILFSTLLSLHISKMRQ